MLRAERGRRRRVLVDPFLKPNNPAAVATAEEVEPTHIAITHGHADHIADAVAGRQAHRRPLRRDRRARRTGSKAQGVEAVSDPNLGGTVEFDWGWVKLVPAWHTNTIAGLRRGARSAPSTGSSIGTAGGPA